MIDRLYPQAVCSARSLVLFFLLAALSAQPGSAVDPEVFPSLSAEDKIDFLDAMIRDWRAEVGNVSADVDYYLSAQRVSADSRRASGTVLQAAAGQQWSISRYGDYYKIAHEKMGGSDPDDGVVDSRNTVVYDAGSGQRRSLSEKEGNHQNWGSLGPEHTQILRDCQLMGLIGADIDLSHGANVFDATSRFIANKADPRIALESADGLVEVVLPHTMFNKRAEVKQLYDLNRPGLPIEETISVFAEHGDIGYRYGMRLGELDAYEGVWFPAEVTLEAWSDSAPSQVTVHKLIVKNIRLNQLDQGDFVFDFPAGTEVMDEYKDEIYRIGEDGERMPSEFAEADYVEVDSHSSMTVFLLCSLFFSIIAVAFLSRHLWQLHSS